MGLCLSFVLGILKDKAKIELLSKLNWWLFRGGWEPNFVVIAEIVFCCLIMDECFNDICKSPSSFKVVSYLRCFLNLKNQWKKWIVIFFYSM